MLNRQDTMLSSSSRHEMPPPEKHHAKSIGCMTAIFQLLSKYQNRRKFLTFGKKQEKNSLGPKSNVGGYNGRISCKVRRSPTLPHEIRQSNLLENTGCIEAESASEKRRKLLGALEKCDQDLKAVKKIIDHIRFPAALKDSGAPNVKPLTQNSTSVDHTKPHININGRKQKQQQPTPRKKPGEDDAINLCFSNRMDVTAESLEGNVAASYFISKAMIESVEEVCKDIDWGEKREVGRIGLVLQDYICRDLVDEVVKELGCCCTYTLPLEACKRRLCF